MTTPQMLDERYGRRSAPRSRWVTGILIAIAAAVVVALAWLTAQATMDDVGTETTGFHVVDERTVTVDFQLTIPLGRDVACALEAQDAEHGVVGWLIVEYEANDQHARAFRETIPTVAEATTGLVNACWVT